MSNSLLIAGNRQSWRQKLERLFLGCQAERTTFPCTMSNCPWIPVPWVSGWNLGTCLQWRLCHSCSPKRWQRDNQDNSKSVSPCLLAMSLWSSDLKSQPSPQLPTFSLLLKGHCMTQPSWMICCSPCRLWQHQMLMQPLRSYRTASRSSAASDKLCCSGYQHTVASLVLNRQTTLLRLAATSNNLKWRWPTRRQKLSWNTRHGVTGDASMVATNPGWRHHHLPSAHWPLRFPCPPEETAPFWHCTVNLRTVWPDSRTHPAGLSPFHS